MHDRIAEQRGGELDDIATRLSFLAGWFEEGPQPDDDDNDNAATYRSGAADLRRIIARLLALRSALSEDTPRAEMTAAIYDELDHAYRKHGTEPWSRHQFYAVMLEEVDELWDAIKHDAPDEEVVKEMREVAAMVFRFYETGNRLRDGGVLAHPPIPRRLSPSPRTEDRDG